MFTEGKDQIVCLGDKREYIALDFVKLVCAFLVMMIHIPITGNGELNFWLTNVPCRLAVPFFFLTAGFFAAGKMHDKAKIVRYIRRIMCLYMIYTIVYARWIIVDYVNAEQMNIHGVQRFIYEFFYAGSYVHLWYLIALVWAVGLLYILLEKFKWQERNVYTIAAVLYAIGVCGNGYRNFSTKIPFINWLYTSWGSTRDGIFFGFPYIVLGYFLYTYRDKIQLKKRYWIYFLLFFGMVGVERYIAGILTQQQTMSMLFTMPFAVTFLFIATASVHISPKLMWLGKFARNLSFLVYALHLYIHLKFGPELSGYTMIMGGLPYFVMVAKRVVLLSAGIVLLSRIKLFSWLKYLY